ncbi:MAG: helix-turn-helix transcriptional regulator [Clostridia bacterium]|nr:helix-turn-helix transcriptional regulator [Clostridia bacterium]
MDYNKIGFFIATERKAKKLTQAKLAEKLFVSEKTVSKWENGNGLPDTSVLPKLCEILEVSINELLNGERIIQNNNEQNNKLLLSMTQELEQKNKIIWSSMWVIMIVSIISLFAGILISAYLIPKGVFQILAIIGVCIVFLIPCFYALKLEVSIGAYRCRNCGFRFVPSYFDALWAMHLGTTRHLKCPNCHHRTWCKKELKNK